MGVQIKLCSSWDSFLLILSLLRLLRAGLIGFAMCLAWTPFAFAEVPKLARQLTIDEGLSQSTISAILQAPDGRVWLASGDGLNIYDGETFEYLYRSDKTSTGLQSNYMSFLFQDAENRIWVGTLGGGLSVLDAKGNFLQGFLSSQEGSPINDVYEIAQTNDGDVWLATSGGVVRITSDLTSWDTAQIQEMPAVEVDEYARSIKAYGENLVLIGTGKNGLVIHNRATGINQEFNKENSDLSGNVVLEIFQDQRGGIWLGTEDGGLNFFDATSSSFSQPIDLPDSDIEAIAESPDGRLWFGSWSNGIFVFDPMTRNIENYKALTGQDQRLSSNTVVALKAGLTGRMWIGSYDNGASSVSLLPDTFKTYFEDQSGELGPVSGVIWAIHEDDDDHVWIGTKRGLSRFNRRDHSFEAIDLGFGSKDVRALLQNGPEVLVAIRKRGLFRYSHLQRRLSPVLGPGGENLFGSELIRLLLRDLDGSIWVGTHSGVYHISGSFEILKHYKATGDAPVLPHNRSRALYQSSDGLVWVGTSGGLTRIDPKTGQHETFSGKAYLPDNDVRAVWQHPDGRMYIGTQAGIAVWTSDDEVIKFLQRDDGLPNETLYSILPDRTGHLWATTNNGLFRYAPDDESIEIFKSHDGLQGSEFNFNAHTVLRDGSILVGGINGFSIFDPADVSADQIPPITTIFLHENPDQKSGPVSLALSVGNIHFKEPKANYLHWKIDPLYEDWNAEIGSAHDIRYDNLPAGNYTVSVQGFSANGIASDVQQFGFKIVRPIHQRWYAIALYLMALAALVYWVSIIRTSSLRRRAVALEDQVQRKTAELQAANKDLADAASERSRFYARASHEIRTPISLIKAPLQTIQQSSQLTENNQALLTLVNRAVDRLVALTCEMSEFASDERQVQAGTSSFDLESLVSPILALYKDSATAQGLAMEEVRGFSGSITLDVEALELILHNLLSNAVKHAEPGAVVGFEIDVDNGELALSVSNTGTLPSDVVDRLYRFATSDRVAEERGIEITGAMVRRAGGSVDAQLDPAKITVRLPAHYEPGVMAAVSPEVHSIGAGGILVIEDDRDLREFLSSTLSEFGAVKTVASCSAGRNAVRSQLYNLIVCDIMLPDGSGLELIKEIKERPDTAHIPVIFLTAVSDIESQQKGIQAWADDYLTKPFNVEELKAKVSIRLRNFDRIRTHAQKRLEADGTADITSSRLAPADVRLIEDIEKFIAENISVQDFSVDDLAKLCAISKRSLQRKIDNLYSMNFSQLLTKRRMETATRLLKEGGSVNDVSIRCGYGHPSSFSRKFKQEVGVAPGKYLSSTR